MKTLKLFAFKRCLALLCYLCTNIFSTYAVYTLKMGEPLVLTVDCPVSSGYLTSTGWTCAQYVHTEPNGVGVCTVYPFYYYSGTVTVTCDYNYSYPVYVNGQYKYMGLGSGTKYFYIKIVKPTFTIDKTEVTVQPGECFVLSTSMSNVYTPKYTTVYWTTSDNNIVKGVGASGDRSYGSQNYEFTAVSLGTATITATIGNGTEVTCKVTVAEQAPTPPPSPTAIPINICDTHTLSFDVPDDGWINYSSWSSDNDNIVLNPLNDNQCQVSTNSYFEGIANIECLYQYCSPMEFNGKLYYKYISKTENFSVSCVEPSFTISPKEITLVVGESTTIETTTTSDGVIRQPYVSWECSNSTVVTYKPSTTNQLIVTATNPGTTAISADIGGGKKSTCMVVVTDTYNVKVNSGIHGSIEPSVALAKADEEVELTISPEDNYILNEISIVDNKGLPVDFTLDGNIAIFKMPKSNVSISATFILLGDLDVNGVIDVADMVVTINHILGKVLQDGKTVELMDMNGDGQVDIGDVILIIKAILAQDGHV